MNHTDYTDLKQRLHRFAKLIPLTATVLLCLATSALAQEAEFPSPRGYINDFANVLSAADEQTLTALVTALEQKTSAEISVVTLKTTKPYDVQDYSVRLYEKWKIGKAGKNNGVLLLVAIEDRAAWITTGYGLEGAIPDAEASKVYRNIMVPYFKQGEYSKGILAGTIALADLTAREYNVNIEELGDLTKEYVRPVEQAPLGSLLQVLLMLLFFIFFFGPRLGLFSFLLFGSGRRRGGYWYGGGLGGNSGGFGGGFGGFGGGFTGGGGAGGRW